MQKKLYFIIMSFLISFFIILSNPLFASSISESYPLTFLRFIKYHIVESTWEGNVLSRSIKLEVQNTSDQTLSNLVVILDAFPGFIKTSDTEVVFGEIIPGTSIISENSIVISIDTSAQTSSDLTLIWRIECDINDRHIVDETEVVEYLP